MFPPENTQGGELNAAVFATLDCFQILSPLFLSWLQKFKETKENLISISSIQQLNCCQSLIFDKG